MREYLRKVLYCLLRIKYWIGGNHLILEAGSCIKNGSVLEGYNKICKNSYFYGHIGLGSYIGADSQVIGDIGRFCSIAGRVTFLTKTHPVKKFVSTHPAFYSLKKQCGIAFVDNQKFDEEPCLPGKRVSISIGNDVYIGYGATIVGPIVIGDGAVIAANSTVTHDVAPYSIVAGTPAKEVRQRFSDSDIKYLIEQKIWEHDLEWYKKYGKYFSSIEELKKALS